MGRGEDGTQDDEDVCPRQRGGERAVRVLEELKGGLRTATPAARAIRQLVPVGGYEDNFGGVVQP